MILAFVAAWTSAAAAPPSRSEIGLRKDWALARCVGKAGGDTAVREDAFRSAAALLERMQAGPAVTDAIDALADRYLKKRYGGSVPSRYDMLKCIDLYHSDELDRIARRAR